MKWLRSKRPKLTLTHSCRIIRYSLPEEQTTMFQRANLTGIWPRVMKMTVKCRVSAGRALSSLTHLSCNKINPSMKTRAWQVEVPGLIIWIIKLCKTDCVVIVNKRSTLTRDLSDAMLQAQRKVLILRPCHKVVSSACSLLRVTIWALRWQASLALTMTVSRVAVNIT